MDTERAFTLVELVVAVTAAAFVLLAAAALVTVEYSNFTLIQDNTRAAQEALLASNHMADILRHVEAATISITNPNAYITRIQATIPSPNPLPNYNFGTTTIRYDYDTRTNDIKFQSTTAPLVRNVTGFQAVWDAVNSRLTLDITVTRNRAVVTLHTMIKVLN